MVKVGENVGIVNRFPTLNIRYNPDQSAEL